MAQPEHGKPLSLEELIVSTLTMTDALTKLLIEKGLITDAQLKQKLLEERVVYQRYASRCRKNWTVSHRRYTKF